jgi:polyhydroxyalkanoate synthesis regulator protein
MMPIAFLRQLIRFYGDQMQMVIPGYLEQTMAAFSREQEGFRDKPAGAGQNPLKLIESQVRRNTEMFRQAMGMFNPFMANAMAPADDRPVPAPAEDLTDMRRQLDEMQRRLEAMDAKKA